MHDKKYRLVEFEEFNRHNHLYDDIKDAVCYLVYLKVGDRGWFLYECKDDYWYIPHRIHTSIIKDVDYSQEGKVIVTTENTRFTFEAYSGDK